VEFGEVCTFEYGKPLKEIDRKDGEYPVYGSNGIVGYHNKYFVKGPFIIVGRKGTAGAVVYSAKSGFPIDTTFYVQLKDREIDLKYLYLIMATLDLAK
jgi:type I restriction enzyme S subunit